MGVLFAKYNLSAGFLTTRLLVCLFVCPFESVIKKEGGGGTLL